RKPTENFAPPWERDYDRSFVTESAVTTWNPGVGKRAKNNPFYDDGVPLNGEDPSLRGGAAKVVVDRAIPFMEEAVKNETPFLSVVWFHAPHEDIEAGPDYLAMYPDSGDAAHYYGCITELDEQVGRIRAKLDELGITENTLLFFCSDNGPEGKAVKGRRAGVTNGLRERKRSLYDGGVRVPALACWPGKLEADSTLDVPLSTLDYFPTVQQLVDYEMPDARPIDGQDIWPILTRAQTQRAKSIPFIRGNQVSLVKDHFKLLLPNGELYDLSNDWGEANNVAAQHPERVDSMRREVATLLESIQASHSGADYNDPSFKPVDKWKSLVKPKGGQ
ncbi:MAG: sulfatase-like hydrolase/transferase, partial [Coraliomargarita sp.]|nr:sulfatase-like hydrolase/transferase [Coraliomargarita sp.]